MYVVIAPVCPLIAGTLLRIVNWNTREMTRDCLASVMAGLGDLSAEVILVDNGSDDGSVEAVRRDYPWVRL